MFFDSPSKRKRIAPISIIVIHYTEVNWAATKELFLDPAKEVSAHLVIDQDGIVHRFVKDDDVAFHAGRRSYWRGIEGVNEYSIGIELVHEGFNTSDGIRVRGDCHLWVPYSTKQIEALIYICKDYSKRYNIAPSDIVGHSDVAPWRKIDPGPLFPWKELYNKGIGRWYSDSNRSLNVNEVVPTLRQLGYHVTDDPEMIRLTIKAFQMHYRPQNISGIPDQETLKILAAFSI